MKSLCLTLDTPEENLALDEALLLHAEQAAEQAPEHVDSGSNEVLRLWEPREPIVVLGRASRRSDEVDLDCCDQLGIPVLRRCSGGAAIVTGPGCLMYSVVLSYHHHPHLRAVDLAHHEVLGRITRALRAVAPASERQGVSDLAIKGRKFSGNSLRCKREHLLYHGTILYNFDLDLAGRCLRNPPRQPEYRAGRHHRDFLVNLEVDPHALRQVFLDAWNDPPPSTRWPFELVESLVKAKYSQSDWINCR